MRYFINETPLQPKVCLTMWFGLLTFITFAFLNIYSCIHAILLTSTWTVQNLSARLSVAQMCIRIPEVAGIPWWEMEPIICW